MTTLPDEQDYSRDIPDSLYREIYGVVLGDTCADARKKRQKIFKLIHQHTLTARLKELEVNSYMINQNLGTLSTYKDRVATLKAELDEL
jgi:hypothetical protein